MRTDFTRKYYVRVKNLSTFVIFGLAVVILISVATAQEIDEGSGGGDGEFEDSQVQMQNTRTNPNGNLKLMSRHQVEILKNRKKKIDVKPVPRLQPPGVLKEKEEESSGFLEAEEEQDNNNGESVVAVVGEDDDEDNERENPPFPPRSDAFWKEEQLQRPKGVNAGNEEGRERQNSEKDGKTNSDPRPNIILILTDDQDIELGSMEYMPETLKIFREGGVEFRHGYVTTPMCCPSRSSMLTGLYVHNHQVYTNNDNCSSVFWRERFEKKTFASYLWAEGYYTAYIGKYLNKYDGSHIPHGWDEWNALLMNSRFYNYTLNRNGKKIRYGNKYERDYYPDSIANDTIDFLRRMSYSEGPTTDAPTPGQGPTLNKLPSQPFLLVVSFPSPHGPEDSAPQYSQMFLNETTHHTPSYNYAPNLDKQWILRTTPRMTPVLKEFTNLLMAKRLQTLQSVDLAVKNIFEGLERSQLIDNSYVFYTSDHGYHVGQFGLIKGKSMPYEFDIRVPLFLKTPKDLVAGRTMITEPVLNIDLAPTFLDLAGVAVPEDMDGRSIVPLIRKYSREFDSVDSGPEAEAGRDFEWTQMFLIESSGRRDIGPEEGGPSTTKKPATILRISAWKNKSANRESDGPIIDNETVEMTNLCLAHPHPCLPGQKKYCRREKSRVRFRKCRNGSDFLSGDEEMSDGTSTYRNSTSNRCRCRSKRSADEDEEEFDWESERQKIDSEIEALKLRIDSLRERRRDMRRRWTSKAYVAKVEKPRNRSEPEPKKKNEIEVTIIQPARIEHETRINPTTTKLPLITVEESTTRNRNPLTSTTLESIPQESSTINSYRDGNTNSDLESRRNGGQRPRPRPNVNDHSDEDDRFDEDLEVEGQTRVDVVEKPKGQTRTRVLLTEENKTVKPGGSVIRDDDSLEEVIDEEDERAHAHVHRKSGKGRKGKNRGNNRVNNKHNGRNDVRERVDEENGDNEGADTDCDCNDPRWSNQREKEERKRKKLMSKLRKKQRFLNRIDDPRERHEAETCGTEDKMNCFWHDKDHWRTAPLWTSESFCFCMNSNNNTYSCLRAINSTHNYLYCQFITGFKMYFDLRQDPYELRNLIVNLRPHEEAWIMGQLLRLKNCQGRQECGSHKSPLVVREDSLPPSIWEKIFGRWRRKKKNRNGNGGNRKVESG